MIAIIDYKAGNLTSVQRALHSIGHEAIITSDRSVIAHAHRIIFPGVGAAGSAMLSLREKGLDISLKDAFSKGIPILGICLGTQIILTRSHEDNTECIGLIKGETKKFNQHYLHPRLKIPHMGWNSIDLKKMHPIFQGIDEDYQFYFVHSYYPSPCDEDIIIGTTSYGISFASVIGVKNLVAVQFHPEKSGRPGLRMLENFCAWDGKDVE
ncbi:MAG: imidazole glycerol phosphate synthase subunit HisH [bacterium]